MESRQEQWEKRVIGRAMKAGFTAAQARFLLEEIISEIKQFNN